MDMDKVGRLVQLQAERDYMAKRLKNAQESLERLQDEVARDFVREGLRNVRTADGKTVYLRHELYASKSSVISQQELCAALLESDLAWAVDLVTDTRAIKAWIKEQMKEDEQGPDREKEYLELGPAAFLPASVRPWFKVSERTFAVVLGAGEAED